MSTMYEGVMRSFASHRSHEAGCPLYYCDAIQARDDFEPEKWGAPRVLYRDGAPPRLTSRTQTCDLSGRMAWDIDFAMLARWCLTIFLIVSGGVLAAGPISSVAVAFNMLCADTETGYAAHDLEENAAKIGAQAHHHGVHGVAAVADDQPDALQFPGDLPCCDHASVSEIAVSLTGASIARKTSSVLNDWSGRNLTELSHPDGLRRPPKG